MKRNLSHEHLEDAALLAYLDAELAGAANRRVQIHLQACWKCRSVLAELEFLAQTVSKLLSQQDESDIARTRDACTKFLELKIVSETSLQKRPPTRSFFKQISIDIWGCDRCYSGVQAAANRPANQLCQI
jgi:ribosomal protein L37AE/L43A